MSFWLAYCSNATTKKNLDREKKIKMNQDHNASKINKIIRVTGTNQRKLFCFFYI